MEGDVCTFTFQHFTLCPWSFFYLIVLVTLGLRDLGKSERISSTQITHENSNTSGV